MGFSHRLSAHTVVFTAYYFEKHRQKMGGSACFWALGVVRLCAKEMDVKI